MVEQAAQTRIDRARSSLRAALVEMAKAGAARHGDGSASDGKADGTSGRGTKGGQSAPSGQ